MIVSLCEHYRLHCVSQGSYTLLADSIVWDHPCVQSVVDSTIIMQQMTVYYSWDKVHLRNNLP